MATYDIAIDIENVELQFILPSTNMSAIRRIVIPYSILCYLSQLGGFVDDM